MAKKHCDHCGASMVEYRHRLNKTLIEGLEALQEFGGSANLKQLDLDRNQWDNFQKLRYWDLVKKSYNEENKRVGGTWEVTSTGNDFLLGKLSVFSTVVTYRGERTSFEGKSVSYSSVSDTGYKQKPEYVEDSTGL